MKRWCLDTSKLYLVLATIVSPSKRVKHFSPANLRLESCALVAAFAVIKLRAGVAKRTLSVVAGQAVSRPGIGVMEQGGDRGNLPRL